MFSRQASGNCGGMFKVSKIPYLGRNLSNIDAPLGSKKDYATINYITDNRKNKIFQVQYWPQCNEYKVTKTIKKDKSTIWDAIYFTGNANIICDR